MAFKQVIIRRVGPLSWLLCRMLKLEALELTWIKGSVDDPQDHCAHGYVNFSVDDTVFVSRGDDEITVSGAAFYLLRTLSSDHNANNNVAESNFLFPCCAFNAWLVGDNNSLVIIGCPNGVDISISHFPDGNVLIERGDNSATVSESDWRLAVLGFVEQIENFYGRSTPKAAIDDKNDRLGWESFWSEWRHHVERYRSAA